MDQKKHQGESQGTQPPGQQNPNQTQNPNREPAEGERQEMPGRDQSGQQWTQGTTQPNQNRNEIVQTPPAHGDQERGRGTQSERNRSESERARGGGISNRDMGGELDEQEELPERGSER